MKIDIKELKEIAEKLDTYPRVIYKFKDETIPLGSYLSKLIYAVIDLLEFKRTFEIEKLSKELNLESLTELPSYDSKDGVN